MPEIDLEYLLNNQRYSAVLRSFLEYLMQPDAHDLRFWQALDGWSGYYGVIVEDEHRVRDTFFWEGRRHDSR